MLSKWANKHILADNLTEAFVMYQHRFNRPFVNPIETKEEIMSKYLSDPYFRAKTLSLVEEIMQNIDKHI